MHSSVAALFALSGAAGLAFETLWFHQAGLAFGNGVVASALVLSAFMAGLAAGNAIAVRRGDGVARPLRAFAALEVAIGVVGVALVHGLPALGPLLASAFGPLADATWALGIARFVTAFALLAIPSTAMGLTLPLLTRALSSSAESFGPALGRLYGWNTLGAVAGVAIAEGFAIGALGIRGTALAAGTANVCAASGALILSRRLTPAPPVEAPSRPGIGVGLPWRAAAFGAGFAMLALEVVGFRFLSLFVVTRSEAFAWMLCTVLVGLGLGGLLGGIALRRSPGASSSAAAIACACGIAVVASYAAFPSVSATLGPSKVDDAGEILRLCAVLLLPAALLSGALFVACGAGLRSDLGGTARSAGSLSVANTLGAAAGSLAGAFALLPGLGMERSLFAIALLYAAIAVGLAARAAARAVALPTALALAAALALFPFGAMRERHLARALEAYDVPDAAHVVVREGTNETVLWIEVPFLGEPYTHRLVTNSFSMSATDVQARRYMKLYAYWPAAVHPALRDALLVSYGVGSTARALADTPGLSHLDVVDLSREILETSARAFPDPARNPLDDPRVRVHVEDGRQFLRTTSRRYDLVTGEPPPPMLAGVVNLYTREYFELVRSRLRDGGMFTTWLPLRSLTDASALSIVRAFCDAFRDCSLWRGMSFDLMLVGSRGAEGPVPEAHFTAQWRDPRVRPELEALGFERPEQLGALFIADADDLERFTRDVPALVDDRPKRITAPATSIEAQHRLYAEWLDPSACRARFGRSALVERLWPPAMRSGALAFFELQHLLDSFGADIRSDAWSERLTDLRAVLGRSAARTPVLWLLGSDADAQRIVAAAPDGLRERSDVQLHLAARALADRDPDGALTHLERAAAGATTAEDFERATALQMFTLCWAGARAEADALARRVGSRLGGGERIRDLWSTLGETCGIGPAARRSPAGSGAGPPGRDLLQHPRD